MDDVFTTSASTSELIDFLPEWQKSPADFKRYSEPMDPKKVMEQARKRITLCDFIGSVHHLKMCYFAGGFRFIGSTPVEERWLKTSGAARRIFRLQRDVWTEFELNDAAVVVWFTPQSNTAVATPVVLDGEIVDYTDTFGVERLKVKLQKKTLSKEEKDGVDDRWAKAYEKGGEVVLDPDKGENFRVLTRAKLGKGLGMPRLRQVLDLLGTRDLLKAGDWAGAWQGRDVIREVKAGYQSQLPQGGEDIRSHITKALRQQIEKQLKGKHGAFDLVVNFDVTMAYKHMDMNFFNAEKFAGTMAMLRNWAGPVGFLLMSSTGSGANPFLLNAFKAEGLSERELVKWLVDDVANDPTFAPSKPAKVDLTVGWNPSVFMDEKVLLETVRYLTGAGIMSFPTARELYQLDDDLESKRNIASAKKPDGYQPPFEPKQGVLSGKNGGDGRPKESAGDVSMT
jgi:hypothetical protein